MEVFNVKVIEYGNGMVEIRKYSRPIGADNLESLDMTKDEIIARQMQGKKYISDICEPEEIYNPFTECVEVIHTMQQLEIIKQREARCLKVSFNRTKNEVYKISRQCEWKYFITLTYDKAKGDRYDFDVCMKKANKWFMNQRNRYAKDLQYIFVPEMHKDSAWHIHGLIARVGNMSFTDSGKKWGKKPVYNLSGWKNGFSTAVQIGDTQEDIFRISTYITKYITKDLCYVTKGKRRYYRSQNIPKPIETNLLIEGVELSNCVDMVADSLGVVLDYEKTITGYIDVDYKYYKKEKE